MEKEQTNNIILELAHNLWKHIIGMVVIFTTIMLFVVISTKMIVPIYEVGAKVIIKFGREYVYRSLKGGRDDGDISPQIRFNTNEIISTEIEIITSGELAVDVVNAIGIETLFPKMVQNSEDKNYLLSRAVGSFQGMLGVTHLKGSTVLAITFQHPDPKVAVLVVKSVIKFFEERHLELYRTPHVGILKQQAANFEKELQEAEDAMHNYKKDNAIYSLERQREIAMEHSARLNSVFVEQNSTLSKMAEEKLYIEEQLKNIDENVVMSKLYQERGNVEFAELKYLDLKRNYRSLTDRYYDDNRLVISLGEQVATMEEFLQTMKDKETLETIRTGPNEDFLILKRKLVLLVASYNGQIRKVETIRKQVTSTEKALQLLSEQELVIKRLGDHISSAFRNYETYSDKLVETNVQEIMDSEKLISVVVIDTPRVPLRPIKPKKKLRLMIGLVLAVASCFFYTLFREYILVPEK